MTQYKNRAGGSPPDRRRSRRPVDDESSVRYVLRNFLQKKNCKVDTAESAEEGLRLLHDNCPDVALVDLVLPGRDGMYMLSRIKHQYPHTEVVLITSHGTPKTAVTAIHRGAYDYLQKPFGRLDDVWVTVQRALEKRKLSLRSRELVL